MRKEARFLGSTLYTLFAILFITSLASCEYPDSSAGIGCDVAELIAAINDANADPDPDTINLGDACLYGLTAVDNYHDRQGLETGEDGANGLPVISTPITIEGNESRIVRASTTPGIPEFRIFFIGAGGNLTLNNTYVEMGLVQSASNSNHGGGIHVHYGSLTLNQSHVMNNTAADMGGGIYLNNGTLTSNNTSISDNQARSGGAIANHMGTISLDDYSVLGSNSASEYGGAIANSGSLAIHGSRFDENEAGLAGGAIACPGPMLIVGDLVLDDVLFNSNTALAGDPLGGGALYLKEGCQFAISDSHFTLNQAINGFGGAILSEAYGSISAGTRIDNNTAAIGGGGISNRLNGVLLIDATILRENTAIGGGGIYNFGEMTILNSAVDQNTADSGGGIFNTGSMLIESSTLSGNESTGIYATIIWINATLGNSDPYTSLVNSTVSGNQGQLYGGVYIRGRGTIVHSTIANNNATEPQGAGLVLTRDYGETQIKNSLVVENSPRDCYFGAGPYDNIAFGENLDSDMSCIGFTNSVVPMLAPLADNGGLTLTHALLPGSPALNIVTDCSDIAHNLVSSDQRGEPRPSPFGGLCDVGAFEVQSPALPPLPTPTPTAEIPTPPPPTEPDPTPTCEVGKPCP